MKLRLFKDVGAIVAMGLFVFVLNVFAAETDKNLTLDDDNK